jgi:release factor glutamine methyltransferase
LIPTAQALALITTRLKNAGIEAPRREARILLAAAHHITAAALLSLPEADPTRFEPLLRRRESREPMAYITGHKEFWGLNFAVSPATLIPRPDSETLIEATLTLTPSRILDLGTGTGCLLLAALHEHKTAIGIGVDISPAAAALAAANAASLGLSARAAFLAGHWADAIAGQFDLILSNPPYIKTTDIPTLMPEVRQFEPLSALAAGPDGAAAYRAIIAALPRLLAPGGTAILELGAGQAKLVESLATGFQFTTRADLAGMKRAAILTK